MVIPAFNEAEGLAVFHQRLVTAMDPLGAWEAIYVDDGSEDPTAATVEFLRRDDPRIALVCLSRNFGKEIATTAGLDHARGEAVIVIDADLQDPPEVIPELVAAWRQGFDMVCARRRRTGRARPAQEAHRASVLPADAAHRADPTAGGYRRFPPDEPPGGGAVLQAARAASFHERTVRLGWLSDHDGAVRPRSAACRAARKWNYWRLWNLALEGITSFTVMPLKIATYLGLLVALLAGIYGAQVIVKTLLIGNSVAGYPSLMTVILFLGGIQLMTLGVIGEYLGRIFNETKQRPLYLVERFLPGGGCGLRRKVRCLGARVRSC